MAYSIDASSDSCYPGTSVLVNKPGIEDQAQLQAASGVDTALRELFDEIVIPQK